MVAKLFVLAARILPILGIVFLAPLVGISETGQATGVKIGEVTPTSAQIWMRLTARPGPDIPHALSRGQENQPLPVQAQPNGLRGESQGAAGKMRVRYALRENLDEATPTEWQAATAERDFAHVFTLANLAPATLYYFAAETMADNGSPSPAPLRGEFRTAPLPSVPAAVKFTVITGQAYRDLDHADGFHIYPAMETLAPDFLVATGDTVYFDNDPPLANTVPLARYHWHRMFSLPRHVRFHLRTPTYWEKDDHDLLYNDCWPGQKVPQMAPLTWDEGLRIFREQTPGSELPYRTFRWGSDLQIWLTEGREFRSPNNQPDGPAKTIWGATQKKWLQDSLLASTATWKVLVSPTPVVGPDRPGKNDNHANLAFAHEGREIRAWLQKNLPDNFFIVCGDRHWQYHSVDPATGVQEFSSGPASDWHAGGSPGKDTAYHRFHKVQGGFCSVAVDRTAGANTAGESRITFRLHNVQGEVSYEVSAKSGR